MRSPLLIEASLFHSLGGFRARWGWDGEYRWTPADPLSTGAVVSQPHTIQQQLTQAAAKEAGCQVKHEHDGNRSVEHGANEHGKTPGRAALGEHQRVGLGEAEDAAGSNRAE